MVNLANIAKSTQLSNLATRFFSALQRWELGGKAAIALAIAAAAACLATYAFLTGSFGQTPSRTLVRLLLLVDLGLLLALGAIIARSVVGLIMARKRGSSGARLHLRLVSLFSVVAVTPTIVVAIFTVLFFNLGLEAWFSDRVRTALNDALTVAGAYIKEHKQIISADLLAMANDLNRQAYIVSQNPGRFVQIVGTQAQIRSLSEAMVVDGSGRVLARAGIGAALVSDRLPFVAELNEARSGEVVFVETVNDQRVAAIVRLDRFLDAYLYVARYVDPRVIAYAERAATAVADYENAEGARSGYQITFAMIFVIVALLVLLVAVWFGMRIGSRLAAPIGELASAVERVGQGDFSVHVKTTDQDDEIGVLTQAFNRMTGELSRQRTDLTDANVQLDERRRFTEAVLTGVSAGVIGLDSNSIITLPNRSAAELLGTKVEVLKGQRFGQAVPELDHLLTAAMKQTGRATSSEVEINRQGKRRRLLVRVAREYEEDGIGGFVVTFDDITDLVMAQRLAAWGEVAQRIAHEIKNPLTPIQLAADRLRSKYSDKIGEDRDIFDQCTETIIRQVHYLGQIVDEFSDYATQTAPVFQKEELGAVVREAVFLQETRSPGIECQLNLPAQKVFLACDARQISQLLTNILKNADEALTASLSGSDTSRAKIEITLEELADSVLIRIEDNGPGFPAGDRMRLVEPYVTTREKGTGLGLAISKRIVEEHGGQLVLDDSSSGGASVNMIFQKNDVMRGGAEKSNRSHQNSSSSLRAQTDRSNDETTNDAGTGNSNQGHGGSRDVA